MAPSVNSVMSTVNKLAIEFFGLMVFHIVGSLATEGTAAYTNGIMLMVLVYYTAKISGAHLNPAVSLTFCLLGHVSPLEMLGYVAAQVSGGISGALVLAALTHTLPGADAGPGCFAPLDASLSHARVFFWEFVFTCFFIVPIFSVVWYTQQKQGYGNTGPIMVGLSLTACALACGPVTGASLNPARSLASFVVFDCPYKAIYSYVLGELLGGLVAPLFIAPWYGLAKEPWFAVNARLHTITESGTRDVLGYRV